MSEQYFASKPQSKHKNINFSEKIFDKEIKFQSDNGVFSKNKFDFGSKLLVENFLELKSSEKKILDLGAGYGAVGISIAVNLKSDDISIDMSDINQRSVELSKKNSELNEVSDKTNIFVSDSFENINEKYDAILLNPPIRAGKVVIYDLFDKSYEHLKDSGKLFFVMRKNHGSKSAIKHFNETFNVEPKLLEMDDGYRVYEVVKKADNND